MKERESRVRKISFGWSFLTLMLLSLTVMSLGVKAVWAGPRMYLDPGTGTFSSNFDVTLKIDTETETVKASEALMNYDTTRLGIVSVVEAGSPFFSEMGYDVDEATGELLIYNYEMDMFGKTGTGDLAVITFSILGSGTAEVNFVCEDGVSTDSNMSGDNAEDVIDCASVGGGSYTLSSDGTAPTSTPTGDSTATPTTAAGASTSTPTGDSTATPTTASELPETGFALPSVMVVSLGVILLAFGLFVWF